MRSNNRVPYYAVISFALSSLAATAGCAVSISGGQAGMRPAPPPAGSASEARAVNDAAYELIQQDDYDAALELCRKAVALDPTLAEAHKNMAITLCDRGRCEEALAPAREAVRLKPELDKAHYVLGKVLLGLGRYRDAVAEYREALRLNPEYDKAHYSLGLAYERLGDPGTAADALGRAVKLKPELANYRLRLELASRHLGGAVRPSPAPLPAAADLKSDNGAADRYVAVVRDYLYHEEFEELERLAGKLRASKARAPGGHWELGLFYGGLKAPEADTNAPEAEWQYHLGRLKRWADASPESVTARVALAQSYVAHAWQARGFGLANTVTERGGRLFGERLALARSTLDAAKGSGVRCPQWYAVMFNVGLGQGWDAGEYERLFREATAFEPDYPAYYTTTAVYQMPRWFGRPGDWVRFAADAADRKGGKAGSALYYMIVDAVASSARARGRHDEFLAGEGVSWPRVMQGITDLDRLYGMNPRIANRACLLASSRGDKGLSRELFRRIGDDWEPTVWGRRVDFDLRRRWAFDQPQSAGTE